MHYAEKNKYGFSEPLFQQSVLYDDHGKLTLNNNFRTSSTADLERHETPLVECLERRFAQFQGGIDVENLEPLQVVRYTSGQEVVESDSLGPSLYQHV